MGTVDENETFTEFYDIVLLTETQRWAAVVYAWVVELITACVYGLFCHTVINYSPREMGAYKW